MVIAALFLLLVVFAVLVIGLHGGPHTSIVAGVAGFTAAAAFFLIPTMFGSNSSNLAGELIIGAVLVSTVVTVLFGLRSLRFRSAIMQTSSAQNLWTSTGIALSDLNPEGSVRIAGETWSAEALDEPIQAGTQVFVVEVDQLHLRVQADPLDEHRKIEGS